MVSRIEAKDGKTPMFRRAEYQAAFSAITLILEKQFINYTKDWLIHIIQPTENGTLLNKMTIALLIA